MSEEEEFAVRAVLIGAGATALIDLWSAILRRVFGIPTLNYGMVGRWLGHLLRGRFMHKSISSAQPIRAERAVGWTAHYATGVAFAWVLLSIQEPGWAQRPTPMPAVVFGIVTVAIPFFLMQPGMGLGIAAAKTPKPWVARLRSVSTHTIFGLGMYLSAILLALVR